MTYTGTCRIPVYQRGRLAGWTQVDGGDYDALIQFLWYLNPNGYVVRHTKGDGTIRMHRQILGLVSGDGLDGDHRNGDPLDNRRENLRPSTRAQNIQNRQGANRGARSRHRGVSYCKQTGRWIAAVTLDGVQHWLGRHDTEEQAAAAAAAFRAKHMPFSSDAHKVEESERTGATA